MINISSKKKIIRNKEFHISKILQATKDLIEQIGYSKVTLRQISSKAGLSIGLIYKDFPNGKTDIIQEIFRTNLSSIHDIDISSNKTNFNLKDSIKEILTSLLQLHRKNYKLNIALEMAYLENTELHISMTQFINQEHDFIFQLLEKLKHQGKINISDTQKKGVLIFNMVDSMIHRQIMYGIGDIKDEELIEFLSSIIIQELK